MTPELVCPICIKRPAIAIDHDHSTGKVRGKLCTQCNLSLGLLNDDRDAMRRAIEHLNTPPTDVDFAVLKREYHAEKSREWREANPERHQANQDASRKRRTEKFRTDPEANAAKREYERQYRAADKEKFREKGKEKYRREMADPERKAKERERIREYKRQQRLNKKEEQP